MPHALELNNISKSFGGYKAVDRVSLTCPVGKITGLIGPNGAGKTTTFNLIGGALTADSGSILWNGKDITTMPAHLRFHEGISRTFQIPHEFNHLTLYENLLVGAGDHVGENWVKALLFPQKTAFQEKKIKAKADEILALLELTPLAHVKAGGLSGGQKKLLELGRALMSDPKLILLDEPAAGVNRTLLNTLMAKIGFLNRTLGYGFVIIEHDMHVIEQLCEHVICMADGQITIEGDFDCVRNDPRVIQSYLGEAAH
jgi:branched-chain amino acid transport system ATP-binding protein